MAPEKKEIERKFRVMNFQRSFIPEDAVVTLITQYYLEKKGLEERRVRCSFDLRTGKTICTYTEKLPTNESGTRVENEKEIELQDCIFLLKSCDKALLPIEKVRYKFPFGGKTFELDVFRFALQDLVMLEVELERRNEAITLPPDWKLIEVTDHPAYKNYALAKREKKPYASYWLSSIWFKVSQFFYRYFAGD